MRLELPALDANGAAATCGAVLDVSKLIEHEAKVQMLAMFLSAVILVGASKAMTGYTIDRLRAQTQVWSRSTNALLAVAQAVHQTGADEAVPWVAEQAQTMLQCDVLNIYLLESTSRDEDHHKDRTLRIDAIPDHQANEDTISAALRDNGAIISVQVRQKPEGKSWALVMFSSPYAVDRACERSERKDIKDASGHIVEWKICVADPSHLMMTQSSKDKAGNIHVDRVSYNLQPRLVLESSCVNPTVAKKSAADTAYAVPIEIDINGDTIVGAVAQSVVLGERCINYALTDDGIIDVSLYFNDNISDDDFQGWQNRWNADPSLSGRRLNKDLFRRNALKFQQCLACAVTVPGAHGQPSRVVGVIQAINKNQNADESSVARAPMDACWSESEVQQLMMFCDQVSFVLEQRSQLKSLQAASKKHHKLSTFTKTFKAIKISRQVALSRKAIHANTGVKVGRVLQQRMAGLLAFGTGEQESQSHGDILAKLQRFDFDVLDIPRDQLWQAATAMILSLDVLPHLGGDGNSSTNEEQVVNFVKSILEHYDNLPYHNAWRAITIAHWMYYTMGRLERAETEAMEPHTFAPEHQLVTLLAALCVGGAGSDGLDNRAHEVFDSELHSQFNGVSPVENRQAQLFCQTLAQPGCDIFASLPPQRRRGLRRAVVSIILQTDHSNHVAITRELIVTGPGNDSSSSGEDSLDKAETMAAALLHAYDLGTIVIGGWDTTVRWSRNELMERAVAVTLSSGVKLGTMEGGSVLDEHMSTFVREELSCLAPASVYFGVDLLAGHETNSDRDGAGTAKLATVMLGYLTGVALPLFELLSERLRLSDGIHKAKQSIKQNKLRWQKIASICEAEIREGGDEEIEKLVLPSTCMEKAAVKWVRFAVSDEVERVNAIAGSSVVTDFVGGLTEVVVGGDSALAQRIEFLKTAQGALPQLIRANNAARQIQRLFRRRLVRTTQGAVQIQRFFRNRRKRRQAALDQSRPDENAEQPSADA